ncbi:WYL domain-containing protein [Paracoccus sp. pheM1]|nr:WYL domain-containing protein [Paracoccus sp. pheM1]
MPTTGIWQEEPEGIVRRFSPRVARDAASYRFHPAERHEPQDDGSLIVRFRADGLQEIAWHLARWGGEVEVLAPPSAAADGAGSGCAAGKPVTQPLTGSVSPAHRRR